MLLLLLLHYYYDVSVLSSSGCPHTNFYESDACICMISRDLSPGSKSTGLISSSTPASPVSLFSDISRLDVSAAADKLLSALPLTAPVVPLILLQ